MFKVLATADFHIDEKFGIDQIKRILGTISEEANKSDELWIAGDIFNKNRASPVELKIFVDFLLTIKKPILMVVGNHETLGDDSLLDWIPSIFKNITVYKTSQVIEREGVKVLLGHFNIEESILGASDTHITSGLSIESLDVPLAVVGHIHKGQHVQGTKTQAIIPGSIFYVNYDERNDVKGLTTLVFNNGEYDVDHILLDVDPIVQLDVDPDTDFSILEKYEKRTRVKLLVHYSDPSLNKRDIIRKMDKYSFKDKKIMFVYTPKTKSTTDAPFSTGVSLEQFLNEYSTTELKTFIIDQLRIQHENNSKTLR